MIDFGGQRNIVILKDFDLWEGASVFGCGTLRNPAGSASRPDRKQSNFLLQGGAWWKEDLLVGERRKNMRGIDGAEPTFSKTRR